MTKKKNKKYICSNCRQRLARYECLHCELKICDVCINDTELLARNDGCCFAYIERNEKSNH